MARYDSSLCRLALIVSWRCNGDLVDLGLAPHLNSSAANIRRHATYTIDRLRLLLMMMQLELLLQVLLPHHIPWLPQQLLPTLFLGAAEWWMQYTTHCVEGIWRVYSLCYAPCHVRDGPKKNESGAVYSDSDKRRVSHNLQEFSDCQGLSITFHLLGLKGRARVANNHQEI